MQLDLTKVPRLEERQAIKAILDQRESINAERNAACKELYMKALKRRAAFSEEIAEARKLIEDATERLEQDTQKIDDEIAEISEPFQERMDELMDKLNDEHEDLATSPTGDVRLCAVSNLPIFDGDETWVHRLFGRALMCLFMPLSCEDDLAKTATPEAAE